MVQVKCMMASRNHQDFLTSQKKMIQPILMKSFSDFRKFQCKVFVCFFLVNKGFTLNTLVKLYKQEKHCIWRTYSCAKIHHDRLHGS